MSASPAAVPSYVPNAVRKQVERANQLVEQIRLGGQPAAAPPAAAPPAAAPPAPHAAAPAAPPPAQGMTIEQLNADWEHKYKVLQGKYNAEVPRLQTQIRENQQLLADMRQQLTNTQTTLASLGTGQSAPNAAPPAQPARRRVKDEEIATFGNDLYDFIKRSAQEVAEAEMSRAARPLEQRIATTEATVKSAAATVTADAVQRMYVLLGEQVPDWERINDLPEFITWLEQKDPYSGAPRGQLLSQAYKVNDGPRVVAFFLGFKNENAAITPQPSAAPPAAGQGEDTLLQLVAPGTPKAGPASGAPNDAGKRVWTREDVQGLYAKINVFTRKNKPVPADLKALEVDLIRAQSEGRIRA